MSELNKTYSPTKRSGVKSIFAAFQILNENDGEMHRNLLLEEIAKRVEFEPWELERYESNGQLKWVTIFVFYSIDSVKAGWLAKNKGMWYLTPEGKEALKLGDVALFEAANKAYRVWKSGTVNSEVLTEIRDGEINILDEQVQKATLEELENQAFNGIGQYLESIDGFKFQKIVGALLKAMGLYVDFIAPPGPDGGVDIIAFNDPLGLKKPKIMVQVKNKNAEYKVDVRTVRELKGVLKQDEHVGIIVTSGYFTKDAELFARYSDVHLKLINRIDFIELWQKYYNKLEEDEKLLLPLHPIYFLGNNE